MARDLKLKVLHRTNVDGQVGEVLVDSHDMKSDEEGVATHTLRLEKGGQYVLRLEETRVRVQVPVQPERDVVLLVVEAPAADAGECVDRVLEPDV